MTKTIYFNKLKFIKTNYRFRSKKQRDRYFDRVVFEDVYEYRRQFKEYMNEKLQVICSWQETIKYAAFAALAVALALAGYGVSQTMLLITFGISLLLIAGAYLMERYFNHYAQCISITSYFLDDDEHLRDLEEIIYEEEYGIKMNNDR